MGQIWRRGAQAELLLMAAWAAKGGGMRATHVELSICTTRANTSTSAGARFSSDQRDTRRPRFTPPPAIDPGPEHWKRVYRSAARAPAPAHSARRHQTPSFITGCRRPVADCRQQTRPGKGSTRMADGRRQTACRCATSPARHCMPHQCPVELRAPPCMSSPISSVTGSLRRIISQRATQTGQLHDPRPSEPVHA